MSGGRPWTQEDIDFVRVFYPHRGAAYVAAHLGRSERAIYARASAEGLRATPARRAVAGVKFGLDGHGADTRFAPGQAAWNKGQAFHAGGRSAETRFKPGNRTHNTQPIGATRTTEGGILQVKLTASGYPPRDWVPLHLLVWEATHGPAPQGGIVVAREGKRLATDPLALRAADLECVTRKELMRRNSVHTRLPPELARLAQLRGALNRQINRKEQESA